MKRPGMIPPGPRTAARRARAAAMRGAWEALSPETRRILAEMPREGRQQIVRAVADGKREFAVPVWTNE